jgi:hypothetical protein
MQVLQFQVNLLYKIIVVLFQMFIHLAQHSELKYRIQADILHNSG